MAVGWVGLGLENVWWVELCWVSKSESMSTSGITACRTIKFFIFPSDSENHWSATRVSQRCYSEYQVTNCCCRASSTVTAIATAICSPRYLQLSCPVDQQVITSVLDTTCNLFIPGDHSCSPEVLVHMSFQYTCSGVITIAHLHPQKTSLSTVSCAYNVIPGLVSKL